MSSDNEDSIFKRAKDFELIGVLKAIKHREEMVKKVLPQKHEGKRTPPSIDANVLFKGQSNPDHIFRPIMREKEYRTHPVKTPENMTNEEFLALVGRSEHFPMAGLTHRDVLSVKKLQDAEIVTEEQEDFILYLGDMFMNLYERYAKESNNNENKEAWEWLKNKYSEIIERRSKNDKDFKKKRKEISKAKKEYEKRKRKKPMKMDWPDVCYEKFYK